ncbi:MAG: orotidine-5'-phosphate decarboxylase [Aquificaceae bacterium]
MAKLCVALDTDYRNAIDLVEALLGYPIIFKVGYKLFIPHGRRVTEFIKERGFELFLDLKLNDIPNTVRNGVIAAEELSADYLTIHILSGREAMREGLKVKGKMRLLGVTLLTSLNQSFLKEVGILLSVQDTVLRLASMGIEEGLDGIVCSGHEVKLLKGKIKEDFIAVVPGIKFNQDRDHKRSINLFDAVKLGADIVVVGRAILQAENPVKRVEELLSNLRVFEE